MKDPSRDVRLWTMIISAVLLAPFAYLMTGCPPPKPADDPSPVASEADPNTPPPGVDEAQYGAMDTAGQACAVLTALKCTIEATPTCPADIRKLVSLGTFSSADVTCIRGSRTVAHVRTCNVDCR